MGSFKLVFSRFCYILCNHEYIHYLNHRQAEDYITRRNETEKKLNLKGGIVYEHDKWHKYSQKVSPKWNKEHWRVSFCGTLDEHDEWVRPLVYSYFFVLGEK